MSTFKYSYLMTKQFHVVAVKTGTDASSVACHDTGESALADAADRNRKAQAMELTVVYLVAPIQDGTHGTKEST